ncbi:MAG: trypsin-like peptidase domain-containing protein [Clostridia bacterium]|nr:trypsin-like peptidase domain-containing protein [Clostridia bacterium]
MEDNKNEYVVVPERKDNKSLRVVTIVIGAILLSVVSSLVTYFLVTRGNELMISGVNTTYNVENVENPVVAVAKVAGPSVVGVKVDYYLQGMFGQLEETSAEGSGIVYSEDGYIITNYHVVEDAVNSTSAAVTVTLSDDQEYEAEIIGWDEVTDLAVLKIEATGLTPATFGDSSKLEVGELAVAIGNPLGQEFAGSVTVGYVSALNRSVTTDGRTQQLIQTDAAINPGNSGGALVNAKGEVIGINTAKITDTTVEGLGFAIPSNDAVKIVTELIQTGKIVRPYIGIYGIDLDSVTAKRNRLVEGVYIYQVFSDTPADDAGLSKGDIIVEFDGTAVTTKQELNDLKNTKSIGDTVKIKYYRSGEYYEVDLVLTGDADTNGSVTN